MYCRLLFHAGTEYLQLFEVGESSQLLEETIVLDMLNEYRTSAGPAPIPFKTQAPMKLLYDVAFARHIMDAKQTRQDKIATGRLPNV